MSKRTKLDLKRLVTPLLSAFYAMSGAILLSTLIVVDPGLLHLGAIGALSLIMAVGVFKLDKLILWMAFVVLCLVNAFSFALLINPLMAANVLLQTALVAYVIAIWVATVYLAVKWKRLRLKT